MPPKDKTESSIIEIIQKMVKDGESEEKIVKTLKELGVDEKKAKRLLLIGEADTFALLRSEIVKIVKANMEQEMPKMEKIVQDQISNTESQLKEDVTKHTISEMQQYEKDVLGEIKQLREQEKEKMDRVAFFSDRVKEKINEMGTELRTVQLDMDEMKVKGVSGQNRNVSRILIVLGVVFGLIDLYFFFTSFNSAISVDSIIVMVLIALISITMFFVATVI